MTKLCPHILGWNGDVLDFIGQTKPRVIKVVAPWGHDTVKMAEARRRSPDSLWLLRRYVDRQPLDNPVLNARQFAAKILSQPNMDELYDIYEDYNEIDPRDHSFDPPKPLKIDTIKRYNEFSTKFSQIVHSWGKMHVTGCWSNGQPPDEAWQYMRDCVLAADYVSLHGYGWPLMSGCPQFTLRYRHIYHNLLPFKRPLILSEMGMTTAVFGDPGDLGWKSWEYPYNLGTKERQAAAEWAWMLDRTNEDPFVFSFHPYTTGRLAGDNWGTHDFTPRLYNLVGDYIKGHPTPDGGGGGSMGVWDNVPSQISQWKELIGKCTRETHVPIPDCQGVPVSPAKVVACIIRIESNGNPNAVGGVGKAIGLMQIWKPHYPGEDLLDPGNNIRVGLAILKGKLGLPQVNGNLREALYWYSGGTAWGDKELYRVKYWLPFINHYETFWGVDLEPGQEVDYKKKYEGLRNGVIAAINTLKGVLNDE